MDIPPIIKSSFLKVSLKRKGDLITAKDGGQPETISVGEDGNVLIADSSTASGIKWAPGGGGSAVWGGIAGTLSNQVDLQSSLDGKEPADPEIQTHLATTGNPHGTTKADIGLDNLTNDAQIPKNIGAASGSLIGFSGPGTPVEILPGTDNQVLTADSTQPSGVSWQNAPAGNAAWGAITGSLAEQADLDTALNTKSDTDHTHSPSQVGLGNVTDHKQVQAAPSSVNGNFVAWSDTTGDKVADSGKNASDFAASSHSHSPDQVSLGNVTNDAQIAKSLGTVKGSIVAFSASGTPVEILPGTDGQILAIDSTSPAGLNWVGNAAVANWQALAGKPEITIGDSSPAGCDTLANALASATSGTILVPPGIHSLAANRTLAAGVHMRVLREAIIHIEDGVTFSLNGTLEAGDYQIFSHDLSGKPFFAKACTITPRWFGAVGDNATDDAPALNWMVSSIAATTLAVLFTPGTYKISNDVTFPVNVQVKMSKGAIFSPATLAGNVGLTNADITPGGSETIAFSTSAKWVTGANTVFSSGAECIPGSYISADPGTGIWERRQVKHYHDDHYLRLVSPFSQNFAATHNWKYSSLDVSTTDTSGLEVGDFLYINGNTHIIGRVKDAATIQLVSHPPVTFTPSDYGAIGAWSRGVRIKVMGSFEAGASQVCTIGANTGVLKFGPGSIQFVRPEWWGAQVGTDESLGANNNLAIERAMHSCRMSESWPRGATVQFSNGTYRLQTGIVLPYGVYLIGASPGSCNNSFGGTTLWWVTPAVSPVALIMDASDYGKKTESPFGLISLNLNTANQPDYFTHTFAGYYNNKFLEIRDCNFTASSLGHRGDWNIYLNYCMDCKIIGNRLGGHSGIYANGGDGIITLNNVNGGYNWVTNSDFVTDSAWAKGSGWTISPAAAPNGRAVASGATATLSQTLSEQLIWAPAANGTLKLALWYTISECTSGGLTVSLGGVSKPTRTPPR